jgi:type I restriction enzyme R subunit
VANPAVLADVIDLCYICPGMAVDITEATLEDIALTWLGELRYSVVHGDDIAPDTPGAERISYGDVVLAGRLTSALTRINPTLPATALDEAIRKIMRPDSPSLVENNRRFHRNLVDGVDVEYHADDGRIVHDKVWPIDFANPDNNDWLAVKQFTVIENKHNRRPDIVVFVNGLPLGVIELKDATHEQATVRRAFNQIQTYKQEIPSLFAFNEALVISDGLEARIGTLTADWEWFMPWRTVDGEDVAPRGVLELDVLIKGVFEKRRFLDLVQSFVVFEVDGPSISKKLAGYHQFHAVNKAVAATIEASLPLGDRRAGVVWHTQGSGKSLSMAFYAGKIVQHPAMANPTLVILTDRNDLDDQLFGTFAACQELLRQTPEQAESRDHLRDLLRVASGGVIFTTIQKFLPDEKGGSYPLLSDRRNIVVIADEAHRSQYDFIDGFARHMRDALPNASFIGFTGTPIEVTDRNTIAVFGDYIDVYDIQRAVEDGATVRIYYEGRLAKIELREDERPYIDPGFEEVTEGEETERKERLKSKWARLEAMVGTDKRIKLIARDIVEHFERRLEAMEGKGMIVCMSRRIAVDLYSAIAELRPEWHDEDDERGAIKVIMTGSASDPLDWQQHVRNKPRRENLARHFKDPDDSLRLVIVRDMWLTGFDAPSLHTMYVDKPMRGHGLMQAIARVNRVFKDKPGGLVVDYLGLADQLKEALSAYTEGDRREAGIPQAEAVALMLEKFEIVEAMFHGFDYSGTPAQRLALIPAAREHILQLENGKKRYMDAVSDLSKAFALAVPHTEALRIRDDVGFFQAVRVAFAKATSERERPQEDLDAAVRQLVSRAVASDEVVDIFAAAGLKQPDISILSDEFLAEVRALPHRNVALELLQKLLNDEIRRRAQSNVVQSRAFSEMLERSIRQYQNRTLAVAEVIAELIELAREMREASERGEQMGLTEEEVAFYDALEANDSAVKVLGDETLRTIARELVRLVRQNATIDWTVKESSRAALRAMVKRLLRRYGYPPDKQEKATKTVLEQAELLCADWAA